MEMSLAELASPVSSPRRVPASPAPPRAGQTLANATEQPVPGSSTRAPLRWPQALHPRPEQRSMRRHLRSNQLAEDRLATEAKNWAADGQLNILLSRCRRGARRQPQHRFAPDTMIVLHVDIASGRAAMIGIPRNTQCVPFRKRSRRTTPKPPADAPRTRTQHAQLAGQRCRLEPPLVVPLLPGLRPGVHAGHDRHRAGDR